MLPVPDQPPLMSLKVTIGVPIPILSISEPELAWLSQSMQLFKVGEEEVQSIPPPSSAVLLVNVQFFSVGEEESLQYIPPPQLPAALFVNVQFFKVGKPEAP